MMDGGAMLRAFASGGIGNSGPRPRVIILLGPRARRRLAAARHGLAASRCTAYSGARVKGIARSMFSSRSKLQPVQPATSCETELLSGRQTPCPIAKSSMRTPRRRQPLAGVALALALVAALASLGAAQETVGGLTLAPGALPPGVQLGGSRPELHQMPLTRAHP
jgi:hypothetical protein